MAGLVALATVACRETVDPRARTYPAAGAHAEITLAQLRTGALDVANYNVECVVRGVVYCPPCPRGAQCAPCHPNGIWVNADTDGSAEQVFISAHDTRQFTVGTRYLLSVSVHDPTRSVYYRWIDVLGYDVLP